MRTFSLVPAFECALFCATLGGSGLAAPEQDAAPAQQQAKPQVNAPAAPGSDTIESIDRDFAQGLIRLERARLDRLARLAAGQNKEQADKTYQVYFQRALSAHLYRDAEPVAERVLASPNPSSQLAFLAAVVNIIAEADRGAHDESLTSLAAALERSDRQGEAGKGAPRGALPRASRILLAEAYYQRLVQADRFDVARKAFELIKTKAQDAAVEQYAAGRLRQLDLLGKPAPAIAGTDIDGKEIGLDQFKGNVVLVVFWATWYVPAAEDVAWLDRVYQTYNPRGFRILGVNLDSAQDGGQKPETVVPQIRRFLIDHNVRWPNLINQPGDRDYARAYGVTDLPSNVLIGRDGTVIHLDLTRGNLERVLARAVGR